MPRDPDGDACAAEAEQAHVGGDDRFVAGRTADEGRADAHRSDEVGRQGTVDQLLHVDRAGWKREFAAIGEYLEEFGARTPPRLRVERQKVADALG